MGDKGDLKKKTKADARSLKKPSKSQSPKYHKKIWVVLPALLLFFSLVVLCCFLFRPITLDPSDPKSSPTYSPAFFIYSDGKYILWNSDGISLSNDCYSSKSAFIGGYAYVKRGREYAIIKDDGSISVDYGIISELLDSKSGLYLVEDNHGERVLLSGNGKVLLNGDDLSIDAPSSTSSFAIANTNGKYYVFNYSGILMSTFDQINDTSVGLSNVNDFGLVYYDEHNMIFDNRTGKFLASVEGSRFVIDSVSTSRSTILLYERDDHSNYKLVKQDGTIFELSGLKNYGIVRGTDIVVGYDNYDEIALLDQNYKAVDRVNSNLALKNLQNYATIDTQGQAVIYYHGKPIKAFETGSTVLSGVLLYDDLYAIKDGSEYNFYQLNGSLAFGGHAFVDDLFDKFHHASVSDDGENYYLIDSKGNKLNDFTYHKVYPYNNSYLVIDNDNKCAVLSAAGTPITDFVYSDASNRSIAVGHDIWTLKIDKHKYDIIDAISDKPLLLSSVDLGDFYENYFTIKTDDGYDYYTYSGYKFLSSTK